MMKVKDNKVEADKIYDELYQSIRDRVLTAEQRNKLDHPTTAPATQPAKTARRRRHIRGFTLKGRNNRTVASIAATATAIRRSRDWADSKRCRREQPSSLPDPED